MWECVRTIHVQMSIVVAVGAVIGIGLRNYKCSPGGGGGVTQQSGEQENTVVFITMQSNWIRLDSVSFLYLVQLDECYEERKIDGRSVKIGHISANRGSL